MKRLLVVVLILTGCGTSEPPQLKAFFTSHNIPSAIMGSTDKSGKITWNAYGSSIWGGKETVSPDNIYRIYSMTKAIASVGAMQLVEKGQLSLDAPLNQLMPEMDSIPVFQGDELVHMHDTITLRHLLTHTAGFGYTFTSSKLAAFHPDKWPYRDYPRLFKSGTSWLYGTSTDWVGRLIEKVSGKDLETYLRENVTGPLKMNSTWFNVPEELQGRIVSFGQRDSTNGFKELPRIPEKPATFFSAGGGLFSSPADYMRFLRCIMNKGELDGVRILKAETVEMMLQDQLPENIKLQFADSTDRWGLAWAIEANPDEKIRPKGSVYWGGAANSYYTVDVAGGKAAVYFSNFFPLQDKEAVGFYEEYLKVVFGK